MKAVIYARYSSDSQREESIEGQIRECTEYAERSGITILRSYIDRALSARTADRPEFQRMIRDSETGLFDTVLVWKLDRFSRDRYDSAHYKHILKKNGVKVISAKENISDGPEGIILESMLEGYAEYYSAELSQKIQRGQMENAMKCKNNGGNTPLGYYVDKTTHALAIDSLTAPVISEIFTRYDSGDSIRDITESLNHRGLKTSKGKGFTIGGVSLILKNRKYIGEYKYKDVIIPDGIPAIIDQDMFERVQRRMEINKKAPGRTKADQDYLLTTKLFCGTCGRMMAGESGTSASGGVKYHYYKCGGAKRHLGCKRKPLKKDWIEKVAVVLTINTVLTDRNMDRIADAVVIMQDEEDTMIPALERQLRDCEKGINNLLNAIQAGVLTSSTKERLEQLEQQRDNLSCEILQRRMERPKYTKEEIVRWIGRYKYGNIDDKDYQKEIIDTFLNSIYVYDDRLVFTYNYKDGTETLTLEEIEAAFGSDLTQYAPPVKTAPKLTSFGAVFVCPKRSTAVPESGEGAKSLIDGLEYSLSVVFVSDRLQTDVSMVIVFLESVLCEFGIRRMNMKLRRLIALLLAVLAIWMFTLPVLADGPEGAAPAESEDTAAEEVPQGNQMEGNWIYEVSQPMGMGGPGGPPPGGMPGGMGGFDPFMMGGGDPTATLLWGDGNEKTGNVVMIPAALGGYEVTTIGNGAQTISSNNKNDDVYVLFAEGITTFSPRMIYDYNSTSGWSIPESVTSIAEGTFLSCPGTFYGVSGSAAETYAASDASRDFVDYSADGSAAFSVVSEDGGYIQPNGTYYLPSGMLDGNHKITFRIVADYQYQIDSLTVDGTDVPEAAGKSDYDLEYTFTAGSGGITVAFAEDPDDSRDPAAMAQSFDYDAPEIMEGAVADGAELPEDVNDYIGVNTGSTAKYDNTMGISTGAYYAADGKVYKMVKAYQDTDEAKYMSKAEAINGVYEADKLVFGKDYDLIRLYNYYEDVQSGPARGVVELYCTYLYQEISPEDVEPENRVDNSHINTASVFVQAGGDLTLSDFTSYCYTAGKGPSEAGNFFGMGSAIHADGGDGTSPATTIINKATSSLTLRNPQVLGTVNSVYATAHGVIEIEGGNIFSCSSGGHGPYVSTGGDILLNTEGTDLVLEDGMVNRVTENLTAAKRPDRDLGTMARNAEGSMEGVYQDHPEDVTVIVTGDEAGTALATDSGGGVIVANQVVTKTFGLRCAGVYSIGSNESWVYCYNSSLTSYLDAGLCSASGGYIFAYNCDIGGVMGIKCRAGGTSDAEETGVHVTNSRVAAYFDAEEMKNAYDVGDAETMREKLSSGEIDIDQIGVGYSQLNMFLDKANTPKFYEDSLDWWFTDRSKTPGYSGGNKFAVIYVENSSTPIYVEASKLVNRNYEENGDPSKLEAGMTPADNLLLSVEGAGSATIFFKDENDQTPWDLTGEDAGTTELTGDFYIGAYSQGGGGPDVGNGPNAAALYFENSQWEGTVIYGDYLDGQDITGECTLSFDLNSRWKVTGDTYVADLELMDPENITADTPVTVYFGATESVVAGTYGNVTLVGPGVDAWPERPAPEEEPAPETAPDAEEVSSAAEETASPAEAAPEPEETAEAEAEVSNVEPARNGETSGRGVSGGAIAGIAAAVVVIGGGAAFAVRKKNQK